MVNYMMMTLAEAEAGAVPAGGETRPVAANPQQGTGAAGSAPVTTQQGVVTPPPSSPGSALAQFFPIIMIVGMFALVMWWSSRAQRKEKKRQQAMLSAMKKGDRVVTIGGLIAAITELRDDEVVLRGEDGQRLRFRRSAVSSVLNEKDAEAKA
jgi:preprotein translocase subunit YajC